jgi:hypothetical protein
MPELTRPRPAFAIVICIYEALIVIFGLFGFAMRAAVHSVRSSPSSIPTSALATALSVLGWLLALGIVITLWQMSRNAFYLAAARFGLDLLGLVYLLIHPIPIPAMNQAPGQPHISAHAIIGAAIVFDLIFVAINAGIAFYTHYVTKPVYLIESPVEPPTIPPAY